MASKDSDLMELKKLRKNLHVLSRMKENEKLSQDAEGDFIINDSSWPLQVIYRKWRGDSQGHTIIILKDLLKHINRHIEIINDSKSLHLILDKSIINEDQEKNYKTKYSELIEFRDALEQSKAGIANLKKTYAKTNTEVEIEFIHNEIANHSSALGALIKRLNEKKESVIVADNASMKTYRVSSLDDSEVESKKNSSLYNRLSADSDSSSSSSSPPVFGPHVSQVMPIVAPSRKKSASSSSSSNGCSPPNSKPISLPVVVAPLPSSSSSSSPAIGGNSAGFPIVKAT